MPKTYLRYKLEQRFGVICSPISNVVVAQDGVTAACGALETVALWNTRTGFKVGCLATESCNQLVTRVALSPDGQTLAAGHQDGSIRLWSMDSQTLLVTFTGHKKAVTALAFGPDGATLASGSADTDIILWDVVAQAGLFVLRGHRDEVTCLQLLVDDADGDSTALPAAGGSSSASRLVSASKDSTLKVWDLQAQTCVQTVLGHRSEVWTLAATTAPGASGAAEAALAAPAPKAKGKKRGKKRDRSHEEAAAAAAAAGGSTEAPAASALRAPLRMLTGSGDGQLRLFAVRTPKLAVQAGEERPDEFQDDQFEGDEEEEGDEAAAGAGEPVAGPRGLVTAEMEAAKRARGTAGSGTVVAAVRRPLHLSAMGALPRQGGSQRVSSVATSEDGSLVAVHGPGKLLEVFRRRTAAEVSKKITRRKRRRREKQAKADKSGNADEPLPFGMTAADMPEEDDSEDDAEGGWDEDLDPQASDEMELVALVRTGRRIRSCQFMPGAFVAPPAAGGQQPTLSARILVSTMDNQLEIYGVGDAAQSSKDQLTHRHSKKGKKGKKGSKDAVVAAAIQGAVAGVGGALADGHRLGVINLPGHRSDIRAVSMRPNERELFTASNGEAKLWSTESGRCLRTMACGYALCCAFLPGGRFAAVGTKNGHLQVFDLASGDMVQDEEAHEAAVWSIAVRPDGRGFATGSADKTVKFWEFEVGGAPAAGGAGEDEEDDEDGDVLRSGPGGRSGEALQVVHVRTLKAGDEVLSLRYSNHRDPAKLLLAVALLDCTIKVFFEDSLKFFLSLYGHKLPVMSMDISDDNNVLISGSADKNVKVWGLEFGDCHRSIFAHSDSVMAVGFVGKTHLFFSAGKEGLLKHWDGDRFVRIHECSGHSGAIRGIATGRTGMVLASVAADRSIRLWRRSEEQVFLEVEEERLLDEMMEQEAAAAASDAVALREATEASGVVEGAMGAVDGAPVATLPESGVVAGRSAEGAKGADRLLEVLAECEGVAEAWEQFEQDLKHAWQDLTPAQRQERREAAARGEVIKPLVEPPAPIITMQKRTPAAHLLQALRSIRSSDLDQALLVLPFGAAVKLLPLLLQCVQDGRGTELVCRAALFLVRTHDRQLSATPALQPLLESARLVLRGRLLGHRATVGFNTAALAFLDRIAAGRGAPPPLSKEQQAAKEKAAAEAKKRASTKGMRVGVRRNVHMI